MLEHETDTPTLRTDQDIQSLRRFALRHFLTSRRERISPREAGLIDGGGRRQRPGLRREEVAVLAGVSASWYTWLEQGRNIRVSDDVLESISRALNLDSTERAHLYLLAGSNPPTASQRATSEEISWFELVLEGWQPAPAFVVDRYWNVLVSNEYARTVLGVRERDYNHLWSFFTDEDNRGRYPNWPEVGRRMVGRFRVQAARFPEDPHFEDLARRLCAASPQFAARWARHEIQDWGKETLRVRPDSGPDIALDHVTLGLHQRSEPLLMLYLPARAGCAGLSIPSRRSLPQ